MWNLKYSLDLLNSGLAQDMYNDGYMSIVAIDFSSEAIKICKELLGEKENELQC